MKRQVFSLISLASLLLVAGSAVAQVIHVRGDVPFDFTVGNKTLRAGTYDVKAIFAISTSSQKSGRQARRVDTGCRKVAARRSWLKS